VKASKKCGKGKSKVIWNQQGPRGLNGKNGLNGTGQPGSPAASFLGGRSTNCEACGDTFAAPIGTSTFSFTADDVDMVSPASTIVARDLFVLRDGYNMTPTFSLMVNGVDSALQCSMSGPTDNTCSDTTHAVAIPAGSTIAIHQSHSTSGGSNAPIAFRFGWRATTP
jgi:hypothetical protein